MSHTICIFDLVCNFLNKLIIIVVTKIKVVLIFKTSINLFFNELNLYLLIKFSY